jgi:hypothetical protein
MLTHHLSPAASCPTFSQSGEAWPKTSPCSTWTVGQFAAGTLPQDCMRVSIGGGSTTVMNRQAGGVAYLDMWGYPSTFYHPAFVFTDMLSSGWPK